MGWLWKIFITEMNEMIGICVLDCCSLCRIWFACWSGFICFQFSSVQFRAFVVKMEENREDLWSRDLWNCSAFLYTNAWTGSTYFALVCFWMQFDLKWKLLWMQSTISKDNNYMLSNIDAYKFHFISLGCILQ